MEASCEDLKPESHMNMTSAKLVPSCCIGQHQHFLEQKQHDREESRKKKESTVRHMESLPNCHCCSNLPISRHHHKQSWESTVHCRNACSLLSSAASELIGPLSFSELASSLPLDLASSSLPFESFSLFSFSVELSVDLAGSWASVRWHFNWDSLMSSPAVIWEVLCFFSGLRWGLTMVNGGSPMGFPQWWLLEWELSE